MGVPAFYRWLSEKYPKIIQDVLEERVACVPNTSTPVSFDASKYPNPSGLECDNLYIDMNGIIHPCSHPENGPQPSTELEMYENVCQYIDRLIRIIRPRQLLYLAIDGVAPRAKMNQQRSRRFRAAQEARELLLLEQETRQEILEAGQSAPPLNPQKAAAWDSNVITPGTPFMLNLSNHIRFYIRKRISTDKGWKNLRVIFSDASIPGEGEHKIMAHVRLQRSMPGYSPNLVHVLHGLDADLIMLGLATHEAHFYISRELVLFGRKSQEQLEQRQLESGFRDAQLALDEAAGEVAMQLMQNQGKPLQRVSIPILREYWASEFASCLNPQTLPFAPSLERLIDDIVFLCFFVGNDFLPHLPSLDIRDGALDYLFNVYKRLLPSLGDYITKSGGNVNLSHVDVLLAEVGAIEDYVFQMKHEHEQRQAAMREQHKQAKKQQNKNGAPPLQAPAVQHAKRGRAARILEQSQSQHGGGESSSHDVVALSRGHAAKEKARLDRKVQHQLEDDNVKAANAMKEMLLTSSSKGSTVDDVQQPRQEQQDTSDSNRFDEGGVHDGSNASPSEMEVAKGEDESPKSGTKRKVDDVAAAAPTEYGSGDIAPTAKADVDGTTGATDGDAPAIVGIVGDAKEEFDDDGGDDDEEDAVEDEDAPEIELHVEAVDPETLAAFKERVKAKQQQKLDEYAKDVKDNVRLYESGWKDRYYSDKCKADDVSAHGGREHLFRSYVVGLCWVMKYYYDGCPSWKWYFPFHYAPFASDLRNIERFAKDCKSMELSAPFNPVEQLMAVLPSDSAHAIPKASRWLMLDEESPIIDFYPKDVPVDPNGKAMPWLWVVLLPFIDEERLLAALSPTMAKWKSEELLCNSRGLDDGYLYVNKSHPLARKLLTILEGGKTAKAPKVRLTDAAAYGTPGFSGSIRPPLSHEIFPLEDDTPVPPPSSASNRNDESQYDSVFGSDIDANDAVCVSFTEPSKLSHKSILLPGAKIAKSILTADDKRIRRPRLNRGGGTIANLGMASHGKSYQSGYGSMNIGSYERQLAEQTGRGGQLNQPGTRAWGAMEPTAKRMRPPPHGQPMVQVNLSNPFAAQAPPQHYQQQQQQSWGVRAPPPGPPHVRGPYQQPQQSQQPPRSYPPQHYPHQQPYQQQPPQRQQYQQQQAYSQQAFSQQSYQAYPPNSSSPHQSNYPPHRGGYQPHPPQRPGPYPPQLQPPSPQSGPSRGGMGHPNYRPPGGGPPPPQGFNFRSFPVGGGPPGQQATRTPHPSVGGPQQASSHVQANSDVMKNLKAQLSRTLQQQNRNKRPG